MILEKYGVILKRLTEDKIELVRIWRNEPKISQYMEYREIISPEMQKKWFEKINNDNNYYFLIQIENKDIGLINIKDIDYKTKVGEAGIFIFEDEYLNGVISFQATFCLYDFFFEDLKLDKLFAHILKDNKRAIKYNKMIGFHLAENIMEEDNQLYFLVKENYFKQRDEILSII